MSAPQERAAGGADFGNAERPIRIADTPRPGSHFHPANMVEVTGGESIRGRSDLRHIGMLDTANGEYFIYSPDPATYLGGFRGKLSEISCTERECQGCLRVFEYQGHRQVFGHVVVKSVLEAGDADSICGFASGSPVRCSEQCECGPERLARGQIAATGAVIPHGYAHLAIYRFDRETRTRRLVSCHLLSPSEVSDPQKVAEAGESGSPLPGGGPRHG